jgi:hypothetical protein
MQLEDTTKCTGCFIEVVQVLLVPFLEAACLVAAFHDRRAFLVASFLVAFPVAFHALPCLVAFLAYQVASYQVASCRVAFQVAFRDRPYLEGACQEASFRGAFLVLACRVASYQVAFQVAFRVRPSTYPEEACRVAFHGRQGNPSEVLHDLGQASCSHHQDHQRPSQVQQVQ